MGLMGHMLLTSDPEAPSKSKHRLNVTKCSMVLYPQVKTEMRHRSMSSVQTEAQSIQLLRADMGHPFCTVIIALLFHKILISLGLVLHVSILVPTYSRF